MTLPLPAIAPRPGVEYWLDVSFHLKRATAWGGRIGDEMAFDQFKLPIERPVLAAAPPPAARLALEDGADAVTVTGATFAAVFDKRAGTLSSLKYRGTELVQRALLPDFWRAWTDNDRGAQLQTRLDVWRQASSSWQVSSVRAVPIGTDAVRVDVDAAIPVIASTYKAAYTVFRTGDILVEASFTPGKGGLPMLPRFGMQMAMPAGFERVSWFGPGPEETLQRSQRGARRSVQRHRRRAVDGLLEAAGEREQDRRAMDGDQQPARRGPARRGHAASERRGAPLHPRGHVERQAHV